eukprot:TRINITY_DN2835_c12_g1_i1.p1 TRINITY_DN2835_c12_g1~~TRINITY_DN2835_c12_g1_i1.p1  ORF type:complete len:103 (+),score=6.23 TRINITY_DN2835_c12_g1_i1:94-402(+)
MMDFFFFSPFFYTGPDGKKEKGREKKEEKEKRKGNYEEKKKVPFLHLPPVTLSDSHPHLFPSLHLFDNIFLFSRWVVANTSPPIIVISFSSSSSSSFSFSLH